MNVQKIRQLKCIAIVIIGCVLAVRVTGENFVYMTSKKNEIVLQENIFGERREKKAVVIIGKVEDLPTTANISIEYSFGYHFKKPDNKFSITEKLTPSSLGSFCFNIPEIDVIDKISYVTLKRNSDYYSFRNYFVEPGDSVLVDIKWEKNVPILSFSGSGSAKYQCRFEIERIYHRYIGIIDNAAKKVGKHSNWGMATLEELSKIYQDCQNEMLNILDKYSKQIAKVAYEGMKADIIAYDLYKVKVLWEVKKLNSSINNKELIAFFRKKFLRTNMLSDTIGILSPEYIDYFANLSALDLYINSYGRLPTFSETFEYVIENYRGDTRERILYDLIGGSAPSVNSQALFYKMPSVEKLKFIKTAIGYTKNIRIVDKFKAIANRSLQGSFAYNFLLQDTAGKIVKLDDFKGKVVVLDMWFTGCGGCARLASLLDKEVKPNIKDHSKVVFISISTDEKKATWMNSVAKEIYSKKNDINLFTNGQGFNHDLVNFYGLVGLPFFLVIDGEGRIIDSPALEKNAILSSINSGIFKLK